MHTYCQSEYDCGLGTLLGPGQPQQDSQEGGAQAPEASSQPDSPADISKLLLAQLEYYFSRSGNRGVSLSVLVESCFFN